MALLEYRCMKCWTSTYAFPEDTSRLKFFESGKCYVDGRSVGNHRLEKMAPKARCVHSTEIFMLSQLDSIYTVHELNSQLMREATDERELKEQNLARKEI